jgi:tetratricopeptide (TPR) repeat protein
MSNLIRTARLAWAPSLIILLLILGSVAPPALAQAGETGSQSGDETELSKKEQKEKAKQARIEEYLRKKEERRARRELEQEQKAQAAAQAGASSTGATAAGATAVAVGTAAAAGASEEPARQRPDDDEVKLPKGLQEAQDILRANEIAQDPTVAEYIELIDRAEASPQQLAAFGSFLGQNGMNRLALEYYAAAPSIEQDDPIIWLNVGTLHRQLQQYSDAESAYSRALSIDLNNAFAHYNLGAVYDEQRKYDAALEEYRIALTLDPSLGDPEVNPQAANNERLLAVKLMLYQQQIGNLGLPLVEVPGGELAAPAPEGD